MEHREMLWLGGPSFLYTDDVFKPSTDSFLLGSFARPRPGSQVCDLGCGSGLLGLLLFARQPQLRLCNVEIQEEALALAQRNFAENGFSSFCSFYHADLRQREQLPPAGRFDYIIANPPYFASGSGPSASAHPRRTARESGCTLDELCAAAQYLLHFGGCFSLVFRPERMAELFSALLKKQLQPKRMCFVQHRSQAAPSLILVEARYGGKPGLQIDPPWILFQENGMPTPLYQSIYFREE